MTFLDQCQQAFTWALAGAWTFPGICFEANIKADFGLQIILARFVNGKLYLRSWVFRGDHDN